jgi:uncharacterized phosphosugar-binding protein
MREKTSVAHPARLAAGQREASAVDAYLAAVHRLLERFRTTQREALERAAELLAGCLHNDGVLQVFGTGHSHMIAEEVFVRAGGLIPVNAMLDTSVVLSGGAFRSTETERRPGAAAEVAAHYDLRPQDAGVVISNSGRNPAPVEMARLMKATGMPVVAITSVAHSTALPVLDPPGVRLLDLCDVVLDTGSAYGDACLQIKGVRHAVGPTSTVIGATIVQALILAVMEHLVAAGAEVVNLPSANVPQSGATQVLAEIDKYRGRLRHL